MEIINDEIQYWVNDEINSNLIEIDNLDDLDNLLNFHINQLQDEEQQFQKTQAIATTTYKEIQEQRDLLSKDLNHIQAQYSQLNKQLEQLKEQPPNWLNDTQKNIHHWNNFTQTELYLILVQKINHYTQQATNQIDKTTDINLIEGYRAIVKLLQDWPKLNDVKAYSHLYEYCKKSILYIQYKLQNAIISKLELLLKSINYPTESIDIKKLPDHQLKQLKQLYTDSLLFQLECYLPHQEVNPHSNLRTGLLPIDVLVHPLWIRFQYHFMGSQPTNNPEKPEWFIQYLLEFCKKNLLFFSQVGNFSQDIFKSYHRNSTSIPSSRFSIADVFVEWIWHLAQHQLEFLKPQHLNNPHNLAHTIKELVDFDYTMKHDILKKYPKLKWEDISVVYLQSDAIKNAWLESEYKVVTVKLQEILSDNQAWDYVYLDPMLPIPNEFEDEFDMPTHSVDRMFSVFEAVKERYQHVSNPNIRLTYFERVHYPLLSDYLAGMRRVYRGFERKFMGFRTPGGPPLPIPDSTNLQILHKLIHSINFLTQQIKYLENDEMFLDLWSIKYNNISVDELDSPGLFDSYLNKMEGLIQELKSTIDKFTQNRLESNQLPNSL